MTSSLAWNNSSNNHIQDHILYCFYSGLTKWDSSAVKASWLIALYDWLSTLGRSQRHFIASAVIFSRKWLAQLVSQTPEWCPPLLVWCFSFTTLGKPIPVSVWAATLYSCILDPNLGQSSLFFSALNFHSFIVYSYCLEQSVLSGWVLRSKSIICVFTTILEFKSVKVFNSIIPKLLQTAHEILPQIHKVL